MSAKMAPQKTSLLGLALALMSRTSSADPIVVGDIRVTGLSPTLIRVEPKGPSGWEDRTTFMVRVSLHQSPTPLLLAGPLTIQRSTTVHI